MKLKAESFAYYLLRIFQRLSLLFVGLYTIIYWVVLLIITAQVQYSIQTVGHEYVNAQSFQNALDTTNAVLAAQAVTGAAIALGLTLAMLAVPRVRRYEKRLVVDGVVVSAFCAVSVAVAHFAVSSFIGRYLAG